MLYVAVPNKPRLLAIDPQAPLPYAMLPLVHNQSDRCTHACAASQAALLQQVHIGIEAANSSATAGAADASLGARCAAWSAGASCFCHWPSKHSQMQCPHAQKPDSLTAVQPQLCTLQGNKTTQTNMPQTKPANAEFVCVLMYVETLPVATHTCGSPEGTTAVPQHPQHTRHVSRASTHRRQYRPTVTAAIQLSCTALAHGTHTTSSNMVCVSATNGNAQLRSSWPAGHSS